MPAIPVADVPLSVVFAEGGVQAATSGFMGATLIVIARDPNDSFNNFSRRYQARLFVVTAGAIAAEFPLRLMFPGRFVTRLVLDEVFAAQGPIVPLESIDLKFCSLFTEPESYRDLVKSLGFEAAVSALRRLGDGVIVRLEGTDVERLAMLETEDFHLGILRSEDAYSAYRRGGRYLRPTEPETKGDAAESFAMGARLRCAENPYLLEFDFSRADFFQDRAVALIGRNGAGKTQILSTLIEGLQRGPYAVAKTRPWAFRNRPNPSRLLVFSTTASDPYPRTIPPWRGLDYEYFNMAARDETGVDPLLPSLAAIRRAAGSPAFFMDGRHQSRMELLRASLRPLNIWAGLHVPLKPAESDDQFGDARQVDGRRYYPFGRTLNEQRELLLIRALDWDAPILVFDDAGASRELSSGETAMFRFVAMAVAAIEPGSLLLFDEPETHLHPNFISDFMELLQNLLTATRSASIIATHSAYVVREIPRRRVRIFNLADGRVEIATPRLQTFGASIDTLSQFVFGDSNLEHRFQAALKDWVSTSASDLDVEAVVERYGQELNPEALSYLARLVATRDATPPEEPAV